jgi:hypothetical protein
MPSNWSILKLLEHEFSLAWNRSWPIFSAANQAAREPCQDIDGLALRTAIMMIDTIAPIVPLEQASAHEFGYRPAHIGFARCPHPFTYGVIDDRLIHVGWYVPDIARSVRIRSSRATRRGSRSPMDDLCIYCGELPSAQIRSCFTMALLRQGQCLSRRRANRYSTSTALRG